VWLAPPGALFDVCDRTADLAGKTDVDVGAAMGCKFPKHIYHSIACIGALVALREDDHWAVDALGAPHVGERSVRELISAFVGKIAELSPQLVTFNGSTSIRLLRSG
jgi:hypothetical protein